MSLSEFRYSKLAWTAQKFFDTLPLGHHHFEICTGWKTLVLGRSFWRHRCGPVFSTWATHDFQRGMTDETIGYSLCSLILARYVHFVLSIASCEKPRCVPFLSLSVSWSRSAPATSAWPAWHSCYSCYSCYSYEKSLVPWRNLSAKKGGLFHGATTGGKVNLHHGRFELFRNPLLQKGRNKTWHIGM